jgi:hypothetical protein
MDDVYRLGHGLTLIAEGMTCPDREGAVCGNTHDV